ncbi:hypothetical protein D3C81_1664600 [compost metagenome]
MNRMASATSSGSPIRPAGMVEVTRGRFCEPPAIRSSMSVAIGPGATALTRMLYWQASSATDLVRPSIACLLATYIGACALPLLPMVEDRLTMAPDRCCDMMRISCLRHRKVPSALALNVAVYDSTVCAMIEPRVPSKPALLTAISRRPKRLTQKSTSLATCSSLLTSA